MQTQDEIKALKSQIEQLKRTIARKTDGLCSDALCDQVCDQVREAGQNLRDWVESGPIGGKAQEVRDDIEERVHENPLSSVALAFVAGALLSLFLGSRR